MNLVLFSPAEGTSFVTAEIQTEPGGYREESSSSDSRWTRLKAAVYHAYQRLKEKFDHSERVCSALRHASLLRLAHSSRHSGESAHKKLREFLRLSYSKHSRWFVVDLVLAGLGGLLAPLPGPNVFFFYPAVRALSHYFARTGAKQALQLDIESSVEPLIDEIEDHWRDLDNVKDKIADLEQKYHLENLIQNLRKLQIT